MPDPAPSLAYLLSVGADLTVYCDGPCRNGRPVDLVALAVAKGEATLISRLRFRCPTCGATGTPLARTPGNMTVGREQLWPRKSPAGGSGRG